MIKRKRFIIGGLLMPDCNNCKNARWNDSDAQGRIKYSGTGRGYVDPAYHDSFCSCDDYDSINPG